MIIISLQIFFIFTGILAKILKWVNVGLFPVAVLGQKKQGYLLNERKAKQIFTLSQNGIPVIPCTESTKILVQETVRIIHEIEQSRYTILSYIEKFARILPEFSVLISMYGIGATLATRFIAKIGDIRRFHLTCYRSESLIIAKHI